MDRFNLRPADVYKVSGPLSMTHLLPLVGNEAFAGLKDRPFIPAYDPDLPPHSDVWQLLRREDCCSIILTNPSIASWNWSRTRRLTRRFWQLK